LSVQYLESKIYRIIEIENIMKNLIKIAICLAIIGFTENSYAQKNRDTIKVEQGIKNAADTVANKTSEIAAKGAAKITDKTYKDKVGPNGQTIYIDNQSKYYYINKKGHKVFVTKAQLKNKSK